MPERLENPTGATSYGGRQTSKFSAATFRMFQKVFDKVAEIHGFRVVPNVKDPGAVPSIAYEVISSSASSGKGYKPRMISTYEGKDDSVEWSNNKAIWQFDIDYIIQFNIITDGSSEAEIAVENFEDMLLRTVGVFKHYGVREFTMIGRVKDNSLVSLNEKLQIRSTRWMVGLTKVYVEEYPIINNIITQIGIVDMLTGVESALIGYE